MIQINTPTVHKSFASVLLSIDAKANIYDNPNQQGTKLPAWFIIHREPVKIEREVGRWWLVYSIDIIYMREYNRPRLFDEYSGIADALDDRLVYLDIYGEKDIKVHVYDRSWVVQLDALKYSTTLRFRVSKDFVRDDFMQVITSLDVSLKERQIVVDVTDLG